MGNEQELRPCPFCGKTLTATRSGLAGDHDDDCFIRQTAVDTSDPKALARWNRRSSDEQAEVVAWRWKWPDSLGAWSYGATVPHEHGAQVAYHGKPEYAEPLFASPPAVAAGGVTEAVEQLVVREARRVEILNWLQEEIGTGWTCTNCGYCTYHSDANECADCGEPFPLEHLLAFKLHATATEDAELIAESRAAFEASGILPTPPSRGEGV